MAEIHIDLACFMRQESKVIKQAFSNFSNLEVNYTVSVLPMADPLSILPVKQFSDLRSQTLRLKSTQESGLIQIDA